VIARPRFNPELRLRRRNLESEEVVASESCSPRVCPNLRPSVSL
jgi:hypothetical protein